MQVIDAAESLKWHYDMTIEDVIRYTVFGLTRVRYCNRDGQFDTQFQCAPGEQPSYLIPWFKMRKELLNNQYKLIFGHWAALGLYQDNSVICCDSGCVWGNQLTALKVDSDSIVYQVNSNFNASRIIH